MRDDFGDLARFHATIEGDVQVMRHLHRLVASDQRRDSYDAAIAWTKCRPLPQIGDWSGRILLKSRRDGLQFIWRLHWIRTPIRSCVAELAPMLSRQGRAQTAIQPPISS